MSKNEWSYDITENPHIKRGEHEKKYCFEDMCFYVDKNLKKKHLDKINKNKHIKILSVSGGMKSGSHIVFETDIRKDIKESEQYLKERLPSSRISCDEWSSGYANKKRKIVQKSCSVNSKKRKSLSWWEKASDVVSKFR